jgi:hypothetical protein
MALEPCTECGKDVSTSAAACPACGHPVQLRRPEPSATPESSPNPDSSADNAPSTAGEDTVTTKQGCIGCLGAIAVIALVMVLWSLGGSFIGWVSGDSDPNKEGSSAWCRTNNVAEDFCGPLSDLAESRGMTPSEYLIELKESDQLVSAVEEGSYRWCSDRALSRQECDNVNELAETFNESPQSVYETLLKAVDTINEGSP